MKAVVQRVARASVAVDGRDVASIGAGLLVLAGIEAGDAEGDVAWMADKVANLRIFEDAAGKMNLSVKDPGPTGSQRAILLVPNFTVAGDARKGRRPSFDGAMRPELAEPMFVRLVAAVRAYGVEVGTGVFRAHMAVSLVNDGPVTILLESRAASAGQERQAHRPEGQ
jgi:D-tyrosyl-tRNA(Tyr) deacylase